MALNVSAPDSFPFSFHRSESKPVATLNIMKLEHLAQYVDHDNSEISEIPGFHVRSTARVRLE